MIFYGDQSKGHNRMASNRIKPRFFHGSGTDVWHGTSLFHTSTPNPTYMTPHAAQKQQLPTSPPSIVILPALTSSSQLPLKLLGHGTRWLLSWFRKLAGGSHLSPRTPGRQYFCSSACPLPFNSGLLPQECWNSAPRNSSICGTFAPGSESSMEHSFQGVEWQGSDPRNVKFL